MIENKKTAIVIGATGLVGSQLVKLLLNDDNYSLIKIFARKTTKISNPKLMEHIVDFSKPDEWRDEVKGDVLFSAMGTTLAKAGSKERQYEIDYHYQYNTAVTAAANGVKDYVLISAMNANPDSSFFYPRMKGELEDSVSKLPFSTITIMQPGLLCGKRTEKRSMEDFSIKLVRWLNKLGLMKSSKPIDGKQVARATLCAYDMTIGINRYKGSYLFELAAKYGL